MSEIRSRREFLTGVLACGTVTAAATYLLPGGNLPTVELVLVSGRDSTGARRLLIDLWNQANPRTQVTLVPAGSRTSDEKRQMENAARNGDADIVNLDTIDIPDFKDQGLIDPIELEDYELFIDRIISTNRSDDDRYWAVPFNADVGVLFHRRNPGEPESKIGGLANVIDQAPKGSHSFVGQLQPSASTGNEAFVVNVLEHAISRDDGILHDNGRPRLDLPRWQEALAPLRTAVAEDRIRLTGSEDESNWRFRLEPSIRFMRNWPDRYRVLQERNDPAVREGRIGVHALPTGILGGRSLAVVRNSDHKDRAADVIRFLTGVEAQKIIAAHGLLPTRYQTYDDTHLTAFIPHFRALLGPVERARIRPLHRNYEEFSAVVADHVNRLLHEDVDLSYRFIDEMRRALL